MAADPEKFYNIVSWAVGLGSFIGTLILTLFGLRRPRGMPVEDTKETKTEGYQLALVTARREIDADMRHDRGQVYASLENLRAEHNLEVRRVEDNFAQGLKGIRETVEAMLRSIEERIRHLETDLSSRMHDIELQLATLIGPNNPHPPTSGPRRRNQ